MKKEQNRHSLHLIRQNVPQFILLVIFSVLLGVSVIAVSILMKMFLDIATNASAMPLTTCLIIAVGVLLVLGISQVVTSVLQGKLSCRMELSLRSAMVEHLYRTDLRTFDSGAADNYFTRMTKDAETLSNFYSKTLIPSIFFESFTFIVSFIHVHRQLYFDVPPRVETRGRHDRHCADPHFHHDPHLPEA